MRYALVVQAMRESKFSGKKVMYVLGVTLADDRQKAEVESERLQKLGHIVDIVETKSL